MGYQRIVRAAVVALATVAGVLVMPGAGRAVAVIPTSSEAVALGRAQATGQPVEVSALTTETQRVVANPDGTFTADIAAGPVRFRDGAGAWREVDLNLERRSDGSVAPRAHPRGLVLSGGAADGVHDLAGLGGAGPARVALGWRGALPKPVLSGTTATYPEVRPGVDLVIEAQRTGFEESLVVKNRAGLAAVRSIALPWRVNGVTPRAAADGGLELRSAGGAPVGRMHPARMWDASVGANSGEHLKQAAVSMAPVAAAGGLGTDVTLAPDTTMMNDPKLLFPVVIDPTVTWNVSSYDAFVQTNFSSDQSGASELKLGYSDDGTSVRARSFLRWNTSVLGGKHVLSATLWLWETWAWSCTQFHWNIWVTGWADTSTRWNNQPWWGGPLDPGTSLTKGYDPCGSADGWVTTAATGTFQYAADNQIASFTTGIRADPADESNHLSWKRFQSTEAANDPHVTITYNTAPNTPDTLMVDGKGCTTGANRPAVATTTGRPNLQARLTDPDGTERSLSGSFYLAELGTALPASPTAVSSAVASGNTATAAVPSSVALLEGHIYHWAALASDGVDSSPRSGECEFIVDNGGPATAPLISSTDYPADGNYHGGLGVTGAFTFAANTAPDVAKYRYWWEGKPYAEVATASLSASVTVSITPPYPDIARTLDDVTVAGPRILHAASVDAVGHVGPDRSFSILVGSAPGPAGWWKLDDPAGASALADASGHNRPVRADTAMPAKQNTGWGDGGSAFTFNGSTSALTAQQPVLDTSRSFTVSALVRLATPIPNSTNSQSVVSQDGSRMSAFQLWYSFWDDRWALQMYEDDTDTASRLMALSTAPGRVGAWTHLVGRYDSATKELSLYVNGVRQSSTTLTRGFNGTGSLLIGRGKWRNFPVDFFNGDIDDVRVWQRVLDPREIAALSSVQIGRWDLDWTSSDSSGYGHDLTASGTAFFDSIGNDPADAGSGMFDKGGFYSTAGPVARTDQSFSVSAWVMLTDTSSWFTAVSQDGVHSAPFQLLYSKWCDCWAFNLQDADVVSPNQYEARASGPAPTSVWAHLVGVFDANARTVSLYVNGALAGSISAPPSAWNGTGQLTVGRSKFNDWQVDFWPGDIDDVRVYAGVLTPVSIAMIDDGQL